MTTVTSATSATTQQTATQATTTQNSTSSAASPEIDPNSFLKLLLAELQNQDPSNPLDTNQLVSQLSSISQVQQSAQTNSTLSQILGQLSVGQASGLIGLTATSADGAQSGTISSVKLTDAGATASLSDGSTLVIGQGVTLTP